MVRNLIFFILVLIFSITNSLFAQSLLRDGFENPPTTAKPQTFWTWVNGNVSKEGITLDLEAMKRVGIQEAMLYNVDMGLPEGPVLYMSPDWLDKLYFAASEAKRLGLQLGFHNCSGWSSSGGPWVKPENAMKTVVYSKIEIKDGEKFNGRLPLPPINLEYYQDIAVLAFPSLKRNVRIPDLNLKTFSGQLFTNNLEPSNKSISDSAVVSKSKIIDLSSKLSADGILNWDPPVGNWTIIRFGYTATGTENHPAAVGGKGLEVDKMSRTALDAYWDGGIRPIIEKLGPLAGTTVTDCFIDSYEVGCNNWTDLFREEFKKSRGYDCLFFLPTLAGYYVESDEVSERFLWDFRKTIGDLIAENYYGHFKDLCHKNGLNLVVEPYGGPFKSEAAGSKADMVMGEFWLEKKTLLESPKLAASIAHLNGNPAAGSEAFTSYGGWTNYPATMKALGDRAWTEGINRFTFHVYVHQPWNSPPGLTYGKYGVEMDRMNTWWEQSKGYMGYLSRSQFLLQQGKNVADVLVFTGESRFNGSTVRSDIKGKGYDYDQIGPDQLQTLRVKDGKFFTSKSGPYRVLMLPDSIWATPALLNKLKSLVDAGAIIVGPKPKMSPSLFDYPLCDKQVSALANKLWPRKIQNISSAEDLTHLLEKQKLAPDFSFGVSGSDLNFTHRKIGNNDIYFVANPQDLARVVYCRFRVTGKKPELWDPETGKTSDLPVWKELPGGIIEIPISFTSLGATFIVFRKPENPSESHITAFRSLLKPEALEPLHGLRIIKAEYGIFLPDGIIDVTSLLSSMIAKNRFVISAGNGISNSDPAPGSMKELRLDYEAAGETHHLSLLENEQRNISKDSVGFKLIRALYGKFPETFKQIPPKYPVYDVTENVKAMVNSGVYSFSVSDSLFNAVPVAQNKDNVLQLDYFTDGERHQVSVPNGRTAILHQEILQSQMVRDKGVLNWATPRAGKLFYTTSTGVKKIIEVPHVPGRQNISGPWNVFFTSANGDSEKAIFDSLFSWTASSVDRIRYFSGTAVYKKQFLVNNELLARNNSVVLDLGNVKVIAAVWVNGKNLGILWKPPFRIDLGNSLHKGVNDLEIHITNLWPNRLIGDERLPDDGIQHTGGQVTWPEWLIDSTKKRKPGRISFTTHKYYDSDSELQLSGLLGPVSLRSFQHVKISGL